MAAAFGFMLSMIHQSWSWIGRRGIDYTKLIQRLKNRNILVLLDADETVDTSIEWSLNKLQAWAIFTSLWWERGESEAIKAANPHADALANQGERLR